MARENYDLEVYRDFYGCWAYVKRFPNGKTRLTIQDPRGHLLWARNHQTYRGAKIAMGKMSEGWERRV